MRADAVVHVVDDDAAVRQSLAFLLVSDGLAVQTHESAADLLAVARDIDGCVVTDVRMPGVNGIELLRRLKAQGVHLPVIVMTGHADVQLAVEAMKEGAVDFMEKPFDDETMLAAVRGALERQADAAGRQDRAVEAKGRISALSERERQVLEGLVAGHANKAIAYDLGISPRTVEIYRANVMTKMRAGSLSELVRLALLAEMAD
ncbi:response regulator FixJ [Methylopila musalis]|uniref:Response regulator FixJ n=1 Tax=Methylopila musalis TaxID=1134781 RepID=A0ABW3Z764_9HYPH